MGALSKWREVPLLIRHNLHLPSRFARWSQPLAQRGASANRWRRAGSQPGFALQPRRSCSRSRAARFLAALRCRSAVFGRFGALTHGHFCYPFGCVAECEKVAGQAEIGQKTAHQAERLTWLKYIVPKLLDPKSAGAWESDFRAYRFVHR